MNTFTSKALLKKLRAKKETNGFTLIELMIVVAILGVLTAVGLPELSKAQEKSKDAAALATLANAAKECSLSLIMNGDGSDYTAGNFKAGANAVTGTCAMSTTQTGTASNVVTTVSGPVLELQSETGTTFTNTFNGTTPGVSS